MWCVDGACHRHKQRAAQALLPRPARAVAARRGGPSASTSAVFFFFAAQGMSPVPSVFSRLWARPYIRWVSQKKKSRIPKGPVSTPAAFRRPWGAAGGQLTRKDYVRRPTRKNFLETGALYDDGLAEQQAKTATQTVGAARGPAKFPNTNFAPTERQGSRLPALRFSD